MMKKYLFISFIISIFFSSNALANCDFQIMDFGKSKDDLKKIINIPKEAPLFAMEDEFGGETVIIPLIEICSDDEKLLGIKGEYLFINDKLEQIQISRALMSDRYLMELAMKKYGKFPLPEGLPIEQWKGNYYWEKGDTLIEFLVTDIYGGKLEMIGIQRLKGSSAFNKYNEKLGKWLDTQK